MHERRFAEWLLGRFQGRLHAAATLGDLEETARHKGRLWFWRAYLAVLVSYAWRPLAGFALANVLFFALSRMNWRMFLAWHFVRMHLHSDRIGTNVIDVSCLILAVIGGYAVIRFGLRDRLTLAALFGFALAEAVQIAWWEGLSLRLLLATASLAILVPLFFRTGRRAVAVFGILAAANLTCVELLLRIFTFIGQHVRAGAHYGLAPALHAAWWIGFKGSLVVVCLLCTLLHERLFLPPAPLAAE